MDLTKTKEQIQKFKEIGNWKYLYQNEPNKAGFQHDMAYGDFKDLARRRIADKILCENAFTIEKKIKIP